MTSAFAEPRFRFGQNWSNFFGHITPEHIEHATAELHRLVGDLHGKTFLDIGCGSGIHSLAAIRLGAEQVFAFDYDADSVATAQEMRRKYAPHADWRVEQGSILDATFVSSLGEFDVVYAWGVLMHTGQMWAAMSFAAVPCKELLVVGIYHDNGWTSRMWQRTKRAYSRSGRLGRATILAATFLVTWGKSFVYNGLRGKPLIVVRRWRNYAESRGMSAWHDLVDWAGGYPFEFANPAEVTNFYTARGFTQQHQRIAGGRAINEFVFRKSL